jgi:hypothetical protein
VGPDENFKKGEKEKGREGKGRGGEGSGGAEGRGGEARAPQFVWPRAPKYFNPALNPCEQTVDFSPLKPL